MSTHTSSSGPPPGSAAPHRLARSVTDRHVAGVAGGLGEHFGVDPTLVRIGFVVLTILGGSGVALYLLAWLLLPAADQPESMATSILQHEPGHPWNRRALVLAVAAALLLFGAIDQPRHFGVLGPLVLLGLIALLINSRDHRGPVPPGPPGQAGPPAPGWGGFPPPPAAPPSAPSTGAAPPGGPSATEAAPGSEPTPDPPTSAPPAPGVTSAAAADAATGTTLVDGPPTGFDWSTGLGEWPLPIAPVAAPPPRSGVTAATLSALVALAGALLLVDVTGVTHVGVRGFAAAALVVTGAGLVASAWRGRAWALVPVALILTAVLGLTSAAPTSLRGGVGDRTIRPTGIGDLRHRYDLAAGTLALDLRDVRPAVDKTATVRATVGVGHLVVTLPPDERVRVTARSGIGNVELFDQRRGGTDVVLRAADGPPSGGGVLDLDLRAAVGQVEVLRAA